MSPAGRGDMTLPSTFREELSPPEGAASSLMRRIKRAFATARDPGGADRVLYKTLVDSLFASPASIVLGSLAALSCLPPGPVPSRCPARTVR
jgi:hypothetical protein